MTAICNKENMRLFVEALLSGEYEQGRGRLKLITPEGVKHCCLGVACEVALQNGVELEVETSSEGVVFFDQTSLYLPEAMREWLGLSPGPKSYSLLLGANNSAIRMNDTIGTSFEEIAIAIRNHYLLEDVED